MNAMTIPVNIFDATLQSFQASCADERYVFKTGTDKKKKKEWIDCHSLWLGDIDGVRRVVTPVVCNRKLRWMDAVTGTLYTDSGLCLTSDVRNLNYKSLVSNQKVGAEILMRTTSLEGGASKS
jgi:hypothetical protein